VEILHLQVSETKARKQLTLSLCYWGTATEEVIWLLSTLGISGLFGGGRSIEH